MARAPKIEMYWTPPGRHAEFALEPKVNWRLKSGNGEIMCSSNQGYRDKIDCERALDAVKLAFDGTINYDKNATIEPIKRVGPGRKPK